MTSEKAPQSQPASVGGPSGIVHTVAQVATVVGAAGSLALMLYVGRRNASAFLMVLFAGWVVAPFVGLGAAQTAAKAWPAFSRPALDWLTIAIALVSLALYTDVALRPRAQPAAMFLMVPVVSWVLMAIVIPVAQRISRKRTPGRLGD